MVLPLILRLSFDKLRIAQDFQATTTIFQPILYLIFKIDSSYISTMREVLLEHIEWDMGNIIAGSMQVVEFYEMYLPQKIDPGLWKRFRNGCMKPVTEDPDSQPVTLNTEAFELAYYGPNLILRQIMEGDNLVFRKKAPRFVFHDNSYTVLTPSQRSVLFALNGAIGKEMADVYKLDITPDPFCMVFPKRYYAKNWEYQRAVLLV